MASIFDDLKKSGENAITWLKQNANKLNRVSPIKLMQDNENTTRTMQMGKMYMFFYDPKHKATLPYYDRFPLVIPIERYPDGFLGLNMHYLAPKLRLSLLEGLMKIRNNQSIICIICSSFKIESRTTGICCQDSIYSSIREFSYSLVKV